MLSLAATELTDGVVALRLVDSRDLPTIERVARDGEIAPRFGLSETSAQSYLEGYEQAWRTGRGAAFAICDRATTECLGQVMLELREAGRADIGYWVVPEARGHGRASRAVRLVSRWALRQPRISRLQLWASPENVASHRVAERSGFQREGTLRSYGEVDGRRVDAVFFSLLPSDLDG